MSVVKSLSLSVLGTPVTLSLSLVEGEVFELTTENNSSVLYDLEKEKFEMDYGWLEDALKNFETNEESAINSLLNTGIVFGQRTYEEARIFDKLNFIDRNLLGDMCVDLQKEIKKEELPSDVKETTVENNNEKGEIKMEKGTVLFGNNKKEEGVSMEILSVSSKSLALLIVEKAIKKNKERKEALVRKFNKMFKKVSKVTKTTRVITKEVFEKNDKINSVKEAARKALENAGKAKEAELKFEYEKEEEKREEMIASISKRISEKGLAQKIKIITNSMLGKQPEFEEEFSDLLALVVSNFNGVDYNRLISMHANILHGKNKTFNKDQATDLSFFMLGQESKALESYLKCLTLKERNLTNGVSLEDEKMKRISSKSFLKEKSKAKNISNYATYIKLNKLAKEYGLYIDPSANSKNGMIVTEIKRIGAGASNEDAITICIPEVVEISVLGQFIKALKIGDNLFSGSTTEMGLSGEFKGEYSEIIKKHGYFRNTEETFYKLMEEVFLGYDNNIGKDYSNLFFDPKEENDDVATVAFFVRSGSYKDLVDCINGKASLPMMQKMARLLGSSIYLKGAAFKSYINDDFNTLKAEKMFLAVSLADTGNHTLGGGSGRTGLYFRVINTLQRVLITNEDKIMANSFASNPFIQFKGSRNNNPDGKFVNSKYNVRHFNYLGQEIAWYTKAMTVVFLNTSRIPNKFWKGTKVLNTLDNYIYLNEVAKLLRTEQDFKDAMKYVQLNSKLKKFLTEDQEEIILNKVEEILKDDSTISNLREEILPEIMKFITDEKIANKAVRRLCNLPSYIVSKFSAAGLKGTAIEIKQDITLKVVEEELAFLEKFLNETLIISNETQHKPEFAMSLASGFHSTIIKQLKEGKNEFTVTYGEHTEVKEFKKEDCIKTIVNINGFEIEAYALIVPVNVHDSKNNLVAQGGTTMKEILPNLQFFNSMRGSKDLSPKWMLKNDVSFTRALKAAGYDITFGKWIEEDWNGQTVYVPTYLEEEFNDIMKKNNINCVPTNDLEGADVVYRAKALQHNKELFIASGDLRALRRFKITGNTYHTPVMKKRDILGLGLSEIKKLYKDNEVLFLEELMKEVVTEDGSKKKYEILNLMVATNLSDFNEINDFMHDKKIWSDELNSHVTAEGLLTKLSKVRAIEILPGRFLTFEPSMEKISSFFSRELNTVIRAINVVYDNKNLLPLEELFFNRSISSLEDFFKFAEMNFEDAKNKYFVRPKELSAFDLEHNINGYALTKQIKEAVVEFTMNLNGIENYHQEKLFTKKANSMYFNRIPGFYGTGINVDCPINEVRINPNSQGINLDFRQQQYAILMRYPTTGELGYGVRIVFDETIPENVVACHPYTMELLMGDTDGDCLVVLPVTKRIANAQVFQQPVVDLDKYFEGYNTKEDSFFKKWNKEFSKTGMDLRASAIIERVAAQREQLQFNPEFVGRITSMNMTLCDVVWRSFVEPALNNSFNKEGEALDLAKKEVSKAKDVYNFFINVVQKQLSQIPIAAKNTSSEGLAQFNETMLNLASLKSYKEYVIELEEIKKKAAEKAEKANAFDKALGVVIEEVLPTGYFMDFINITGWENIEGVEILGYTNVDATSVELI